MKFTYRMVVVSIGLLTLMSLISACATTPSASTPPSSAQSVQETAPVTFPEETLHAAATVAEMQGHLFSSFTLWQQGESGLALAHARHPLAEGLPNLNDSLSAEQLDALTAAIEAYSAAVETAPGDDTAVEAAYTALLAALDETAQSLAGDLNDDPAFQAAVLRDLVETIEHEYAEAVADGAVVEIAEYQDAFGFFNILKQRYATLPAGEDEAANQEMAEQLAVLDGVFASVMPPTPAVAPADMEYAVHEINEVLTDRFGLVEMVSYTPGEVIEAIRNDIAEAIEHYESGDADEAYEYAAAAYLEGFELIEGDLMQAGEQERMEALELQFKELRDAIQNGQPQTDVQQIADDLNAALDEVAEIVENNE